MSAAKAKRLTKSQIALDWVRNDSKATGMDRFVLLILAFYVNKETGVTYPSVDTIAREVGANRATVFRHLKNLIRSGVLEIVLAQHKRPTQYRIIGPDYLSRTDATLTTALGSQIATQAPPVESQNGALESQNRPLESHGRVATSIQPLNTSTTTARDSRFDETVKRAAYHRSRLSWVKDEIKVRVATGKTLRGDGPEGDALNAWLVAHPDATPDGAGRLYADNQIPGTERYGEQVLKTDEYGNRYLSGGVKDTREQRQRSYRYGDEPETQGYRVWSDTGEVWTRADYAAARRSRNWNPEVDKDPYYEADEALSLADSPW